jgi:FdhD protein
MTDGSRPVGVVRVDGRGVGDAIDRAATEEPLEVRLHNDPFAVIMRTPGSDCDLAAGFLYSEGVIASADDLGLIEHCRLDGGTHNVVNVTLVPDSREAIVAALAGRRHVTLNSACGMCGRLTIASLKTDRAPLQSTTAVRRSVVLTLPDRLRSAQEIFGETGGLHAAALFSVDGALDSAAEDVGRHNAVDKIIGRKLMEDALPLSDRLLFVSGRTSFEIVQKAFLAGIPIVASVSAPSSLAIDLATEAGVTLVGFVRGSSFNIYSHANRIT